MSSPSNSRNTAFTLIEVLVVTAIICLLAALSLSIFSRVKVASRRTTCASNLRQLGGALALYAQDARSFYPVVDVNAVSNPDTCAPWADKVFPYLKSEKVFECPANAYGAYRSGCPADDKSDPDHPITWNGSYNLNIDYGFSYKVPNSPLMTSYKPRAMTSTTRYTRPSSTILLLDGDGGFVNPGFVPLNLEEQPLTNVAALKRYGVPDRHEGGVNACFADGHVKWMSLNSLLKRSLWRINGPE